MHPSDDIYHTQGIKGFQVKSTKFSSVVTVRLNHPFTNPHECSICRATNVRVREVGLRRITFPVVARKFALRFPYFDLTALSVDLIAVKSSRSSRNGPTIQRAVEQSVIDLRREMSIKATAEFFGLDWRTVKGPLKTKFRRICLRDVAIIGIDEIYVGKKKSETIVRDLISDAVLFVGRGKGSEALAKFERRFRASKYKIQGVAMDMSSGYSARVKQALLKAEIFFDHFHAILLINKKLDALRRTAMNTLDEETL